MTRSSRLALLAAALAVAALAAAGRAPAAPARAGSAQAVVVIASGSDRTLGGGSGVDLEANQTAQSGDPGNDDIRVNAPSAGNVSIAPVNGAQIAKASGAFDSLSSPDLRTLGYGSSPVSASALGAGDVLAVKTSSGKLAEVGILGVDPLHVRIKWVTYPPPVKLSVQKDGDGTGRVTASPGGIDCGATCSIYLPLGQDVTVTAVPDSGSTFTAWAYSCSGTGACSFPMNNNRTIKATFSRVPAKLTVTSGEGGSVTSAPGGIDCGGACSAGFANGASVVLTATPATGAAFVGWGGACSGKAPTCTVKLSADTSVSAAFAALSVARVAYAGRWHESRLAGKLVVSGRVTQPARLALTLSGGGVTIPLSRVSAPSGAFTLSPRLPPKLLPGSYVLTASARLDGSRLPPATQRVVVAAPPEGVIARAYMSATSGGRAVESLPLTTKKFYAHFVFAPAGRTKFPLTVEWYGPRGTFIGRKGKPNAARVDSFVAFPADMSEARKAGTWGCILRAGGVIVRNLFIRLE